MRSNRYVGVTAAEGRMMGLNRVLWLAVPLALWLTGCEESSSTSGGLGGETGSGNSDPGTGGSGNTSGGSGGSDGGGGQAEPPPDPILEARQIDYGEALRTASLKLNRSLPTLDQIHRVADAADQKAAYELEIDAMLASPAFNSRMVKYWRDIMRMGGDGLDTAPNFAAKLVADGRPFTELFTATTGNCPTFDGATGTFADADCQSGAPVQAGVLTDPAVMRQFYGNLAFRRARWVQEVFYCSKFPAEVAEQPTQVDGKDYTSPWEFNTIADAPINFQDTQSVVCANCHTSLNHISPLFGNFDQNGMWQDTIAVMTPLAPNPVPTEMSHWLKDGETLHWRMDKPTANLAELGQVLATDPEVSQCLVARAWNFAMSKEDIVTHLESVPLSVVAPHVEEFAADGNYKALLRGIFVSEDFVSF